MSAVTGNLQILLHISLGQLPISRGGYLGDAGGGRFGCHNDWGPLLAFSKQGPGMLNVLQCAGLSCMMQNFPNPVPVAPTLRNMAIVWAAWFSLMPTL